VLARQENVHGRRQASARCAAPAARGRGARAAECCRARRGGTRAMSHGNAISVHGSTSHAGARARRWPRSGAHCRRTAPAPCRSACLRGRTCRSTPSAVMPPLLVCPWRRAPSLSRSAWRRRFRSTRLKTSRLGRLDVAVHVCKSEAAPQIGKRQRALLVHRLCPAPT
jgi:hypothetical protein